MRRVLQIGVMLAALAWGIPASAVLSAGVNGNNSACGASPCAVTMNGPTTAGSTLIAAGYTNGGSTMAFSAGASGVGTWVPDKQVNDATAATTATGYLLSTSGSSSTVNCTTTVALNACTVFEIKNTLGTMTFDTSATRDQTTSASSWAGVSPGTITGSNDVVVQVARMNAGNAASETCPNSSTNLGVNTAPAYGYCYLLNTTSNAAGTWTLTGATRASLVGIAIKESSAGGGGDTAIDKRSKLDRLGANE